jgi:hypothetical protein
MKVAAGIVGALAGILIVVVIAMALIPRLRGGAAASSKSPPQAPSPGSSSFATPPRPDQPINSPKTREEELREELSQKRIPFFRFLRENHGDLIEHFSVLDDYDTLDLVVKRQDDSTLTLLLQNAVAPTAKEYGFRRVRWYVKNPLGSLEPFTIVAESSHDGAGRWNTFRK